MLSVIFHKILLIYLNYITIRLHSLNNTFPNIVYLYIYSSTQIELKYTVLVSDVSGRRIDQKI